VRGQGEQAGEEGWQQERGRGFVVGAGRGRRLAVAVESGWVYWYHCRRFPHPGSGRVASHWDHRLGQRRGGERGVERNSWEGEVERQRRWEVEAEEPRRHGGRAWKEAGRAGRTRAEGVHGLLHRLRRTVWFVGYEINGVKRGRRIKVE
jgi:hypothetical protein